MTDALTEKLANLLHIYASDDMQDRLQKSGSPLSQAEVIDNLAARLAKRSCEHRQAQGRRGVTAKTFANKNHAEQMAEAKQIQLAADTLIRSGYAQDLTELENIKASAQALEVLADQWCKDADIGLPKISRLSLCADIIVAWKMVTGAKNMPRRGRDGDSNCFAGFLAAFTELAPHLNADNLHRTILTIEPKMQ